MNTSTSEAIASLAEELQSREKPAGTAKMLWPRLEAVNRDRAVELVRASSLADFLPPAGENVGLPPNDYYGDAEYPMPKRPQAVAVSAAARGPFSDGSEQWNLSLIFRTDWGNVKIGTEVGRSSSTLAEGESGAQPGPIRQNPYVYDRIWIASYAETGYEDGTERRRGVYSAEMAGELLRIIQTLLEERGDRREHTAPLADNLLHAIRTSRQERKN